MQTTVTHFDPIDLRRDWQVTFDKTSVSESMQTLHSWADDEPGKYYSGTVTYRRTVDIPQNVASAGSAVLGFRRRDAGRARKTEPARHAHLA